MVGSKFCHQVPVVGSIKYPLLAAEAKRYLSGRRRPWLVSTCLALLGGSTWTNGYFPSVRKNQTKIAEKI